MTRDPGDLAVGVEEDERSGHRFGRRSRGRVGLHPVSWSRLKGNVVADDNHRENCAQMREREGGDGWATEQERGRQSKSVTGEFLSQVEQRGTRAG